MRRCAMCRKPFLKYAHKERHMTNQELLDKKAEHVKAADEILQKAKEENRYDLRGDEQKAFDDHHAEIEKISGFLMRDAKQEALGEEPERRTNPNPTQSPRQTSHNGNKITERDRVEAFRAWALAGVPVSPLTDTQRE